MRSQFRAYIPQHILFLFASLTLLLIVNFSFRLSLFFLNLELTTDASNFDIYYSLVNRGILFDLYISMIILLLPFFLVSIPFLMRKNSRLLLTISNWIITLLAIINIAVSVSDLGFFSYYNSRITNAVFNWTDDIGLMLKVMKSDKSYSIAFALFIVVAGIYIFVQSKIYKTFSRQSPKQFSKKSRLIIFFLSLSLVFFGIRGSFNFHRMPLNSNDAYFSDNPFLNQLSFNPVFTLANSYRNSEIEYFKSDEEAVNKALQYLEKEKGKEANPFTTFISGSDSIKPNIILIFLESMSNAMVSRYNPEHRTTPLLDSLSQQGIVFDNFFSAGIHTYNGIFSSLYGLPAIMHNKPLNAVETANMKFYGLPWILKEKGYKTLFYVTGAKRFDNMNGFLIPNGFDEMIGDSDYPADSMYDGWGVSDKTMFNRVLNDCDSMYNSGAHFFTNILTITTHDGYLVPSSYDEKLSNQEYPYKLYEYGDLLLEEFMNTAKSKEWFKNTVFVFVGDHGQNFSAVYDMSLSYHRVPLIIYAPEYFDHIAYKSPALQQDIYPTLCGLLDFSYMNNGLGVDLLNHKRKYAYFSADNKLGIIDSQYFLIFRNKDNISMYNYKINSIEDVYSEKQREADSMQSYGFSMLQSAQFLIDNKLTSLK